MKRVQQSTVSLQLVVMYCGVVPGMYYVPSEGLGQHSPHLKTSLIFAPFYINYSTTDTFGLRLFHVLSRIHDTQLEIAGLRVVYQSESEEPVLVLLISGHTVMPR